MHFIHFIIAILLDLGRRVKGLVEWRDIFSSMFMARMDTHSLQELQELVSPGAETGSLVHKSAGIFTCILGLTAHTRI